MFIASKEAINNPIAEGRRRRPRQLRPGRALPVRARDDAAGSRAFRISKYLNSSGVRAEPRVRAAPRAAVGRAAGGGGQGEVRLASILTWVFLALRFAVSVGRRVISLHWFCSF